MHTLRARKIALRAGDDERLLVKPYLQSKMGAGLQILEISGGNLGSECLETVLCQAIPVA
jgi:hypothetical protein